MTKALVLENVSSLDPDLHCFLDRYDFDAEVLYHASDLPPSELMERIAAHDTIIFKSLLGNRKQLAGLMDMILHLGKLKVIYVFYGFQDAPEALVKFLSLTMEEELRQKLRQLLGFCVLFDVRCQTYDRTTDPEAFFRKLEYGFDSVPIRWVEDFEVFWHTRKPMPTSPMDFLYAETYVAVPRGKGLPKPKTKRVLTKAEVVMAKRFLDETAHYYADKLEDWENGVGPQYFDSDELAEVDADRRGFVDIIPKLRKLLRLSQTIE